MNASPRTMGSSPSFVHTLETPEEASRIARDILAETQNTRIFVVNGELGSGKTTLIKGFGHVLGVKDPMASPSFSLINEYHSPKEGSIYHIDLYRVEHPEEAYDLGISEILEERAWCFIEWAGPIHNLLPADHVEMAIEKQKGSQVRTVRIFTSVGD